MKITPHQYRQLCPLRKVRRHIRRTAQLANNQIDCVQSRTTLKFFSAVTQYYGTNVLRCRLKNRSAYILTTAYDK